MRPAIASAFIALAVVVPPGCAGTIVQPSDLPPLPRATRPGAGAVVLLLEGAPEPMADEIRGFARGLGSAREGVIRPGGSLHAACEVPQDLILRPRLGRTHFVSNAPDRNTLFIYETSIVVGIPVTLISAVAWKYYAETLVEAELEVLACAESEPSRHVGSFMLRSEGRGFVRTDTLQDAQYAPAVRGVVRKLIAEILEGWMRKEEQEHE